MVVGSSFGGTDALVELCRGLPADFPWPVVVVLHRGSSRVHPALELLSRVSAWPVQEAEDKAPLAPGVVWIAPADYHLFVEERSLALGVDEPECFARPSIDALFRSAADVWGPRAVALVLSGAAEDGVRGAAAVAARGGTVWVQPPEEAPQVGRILPSGVLQSGVGAAVPVREMMPRLVRWAAGGPASTG